MKTNSQKKLKIVRVMGIALDEVVANRQALLRACCVPVILMAIFSYPAFAPSMPLIGSILGMLTFTVFTVSCHRIILLGPSAMPNRWGVYFTGREVRFLLIALAIAVPGSCLLLLGTLALKAVLPTGTWAFPILVLILSVPIAYWSARIFMLLPGTAVDQTWTPKAALAITKKHGWKLVGLSLATGIVIGWPTLLFKMIGTEHQLLIWLLWIPFQVLTVYGVAVLSVAYLSICPENLRPVRACLAPDLYLL